MLWKESYIISYACIVSGKNRLKLIIICSHYTWYLLNGVLEVVCVLAFVFSHSLALFCPKIQQNHHNNVQCPLTWIKWEDRHEETELKTRFTSSSKSTWKFQLCYSMFDTRENRDLYLVKVDNFVCAANRAQNENQSN